MICHELAAACSQLAAIPPGVIARPWGPLSGRPRRVASPCDRAARAPVDALIAFAALGAGRRGSPVLITSAWLRSAPSGPGGQCPPIGQPDAAWPPRSARPRGRVDRRPAAVRALDPGSGAAPWPSLGPGGRSGQGEGTRAGYALDVAIRDIVPAVPVADGLIELRLRSAARRTLGDGRLCGLASLVFLWMTPLLADLSRLRAGRAQWPWGRVESPRRASLACALSSSSEVFRLLRCRFLSRSALYAP